MKIDGYFKFLLTLFVLWLFFQTVLSNRYNLHNRKIGDIDQLYRIDKLSGQTDVLDRETSCWVVIGETGKITVPKDK